MSIMAQIGGELQQVLHRFGFAHLWRDDPL